MPVFREADAIVNLNRVVERNLSQDPRQRYFLYVPQSGAVGSKVLVIVHGISRRAREYIRQFAHLSERRGVVMVAPLFTRRRFPDYQRLGYSGKGERPDRVLFDILAEVHSVTRADVREVYLFGYSGGGQFVHRYAMAYPQRTAAVAIGAAGWYTFPDPAVPFPRGLKHTSTLADITFRPCQFLKVPMAVFVGERDYLRDLWLNKSRKINNQQGYTRLERAGRWVEAMRAAAVAHGIPARYELDVMPNVGHSFMGSMKRGHMGERVFEFLFGSERKEASLDFLDGRQRSAAPLFSWPFGP